MIALLIDERKQAMDYGQVALAEEIGTVIVSFERLLRMH
jgi:hypothetical protein